MAQQDELQRIRSHLRRREGLFRLKVAMMIALGVALSFLGPFLLATILWILGLWASALFHLPALSLRWWWLFLPLAIVMVTLFYYFEARTDRRRSKGLTGTGRAKAPSSGPPVPDRARAVGAPGAAVAEPRSSSAGLFEVFFVGSRMAVSACRQIKASRRLRANRDRAALIVRQLIAQTSGVDTPRLLLEGEKLDDIRPELAYLSFHQWVGIGEKRSRVWLYSTARETLRS